MFKIMMILLVSISAHAQSDWRCSDHGEGSEMVGNSFYACGTGQSESEGRAQEYATIRAQNEFVNLCNLSPGCYQKQRTVDPGKMVCDQLPHGSFRCHRLLIFTFTTSL